jgi:rubrerythrin
MLKKIVLGLLLIGFISVLVWGGVNRTLAKTNDVAERNTNNQGTGQVSYSEGNGAQQRGNGNQEKTTEEECDEEGPNGNAGEQTGANLQGQSNGNGFRGDSAKENNDTHLEDGLGNSYGTSSNAQAQSQGNGNRGGNGNGRGNGQGGDSDPLTTTEIEALTLALDDEYHALAVYQSVIAAFGEVEPFAEIAASEQRHIEALVNQFNKHGLPIPENLWVENVPVFDSLQQACQAGVEAEIANANLYDQLFSMTDDPSLTRVFTNLSNASLNSHLPQFEACQ